MALSTPLVRYLENELSAHHLRLQISKISPVSGGDINMAYRLETTHGRYFVKLNSKTRYPGMFKCEAAALNTIAATQTIAVPQVIYQGDFDDQSFLILEWIESGSRTATASANLGRQLAAMHRVTADYFGFDADNYMGSLPQSNRKHHTWSQFFTDERLQPMVELAFNNGYLNQADLLNSDALFNKFGDLFDEEVPALIHGDLWGGNYLISEDGQPYLIDPAVSYGHREFDIAMTTLFGGFDDAFYSAYHEAFPLPNGWQQRTDLWNLYPLLIHLNLFGRGYLAQVRGCLNGYL